MWAEGVRCRQVRNREDVHEVSGINKNEVSSLQHDSIPVSRGSVARSDMALSGDSVSGKV